MFLDLWLALISRTDHDANLGSLRAEKELIEITKFSEKREGCFPNYEIF